MRDNLAFLSGRLGSSSPTMILGTNFLGKNGSEGQHPIFYKVRDINIFYLIKIAVRN